MIRFFSPAFSCLKSREQKANIRGVNNEFLDFDVTSFNVNFINVVYIEDPILWCGDLHCTGTLVCSFSYHNRCIYSLHLLNQRFSIIISPSEVCALSLLCALLA